MSISLEKKPDLGDIIYEYSNEIFYRFDVGVSLIDSLKNHIDEGTYLHNKAYFQYSDAVSYFCLVYTERSRSVNTSSLLMAFFRFALTHDTLANH